MYTKSYVYGIYTITPMLIAGGSLVDTPIDITFVRDSLSELPIIPSSSLKGQLRFVLDSRENLKNILFGSENSEDKGKISLTDGFLASFPIKSKKGLFGWISGAYNLRHLSLLNSRIEFNPISFPVNNDKAYVSDKSTLKDNDSIYFDQFKFNIEIKSKELEKIREFQKQFVPTPLNEKFNNDYCTVSDEVMKYAVKYGMEIRHRIKIDPATGTVKSGALWDEEYVPAYTLFLGLILVQKDSENEFKLFVDELKKKNNIIQLGGNKGIGKGFAQITIVD